MERLQHIKDKLVCIGESYDSLKPFIQEYLDRIETLIEEQKDVVYKAIKALKDNALTPVAIAKKLGCSRTTLYNHNQILKRYIEHSAECLSKQNPLLEIEENTYKRQMLEEKVTLMEIRDINNEQLKHEHKMLTDLINCKNSEIQRLQRRVRELTAELQKYR